MRLHIVIAIYLLIAMTATGQLVYDFKCNDHSSEKPYNLACTSSGLPHEKLILNCSLNHVVVATICLGQEIPASTGSTCSYNETNCHGDYSAAFQDGADQFTSRVDECLWKDDDCDLGPRESSSWQHTCEGNPPSLTYDYVAAFHFQCVNASVVYPVCQQNASLGVVFDPADIGYVMSPAFPKAIPMLSCSRDFLFGTRMYIEFLIQFTDLDSSSDFVRIDMLDENGDILEQGPEWTGPIHDPKPYILEAFGFSVILNIAGSNNRRGFLLSYSALIANETETTAETIQPTTAAMTSHVISSTTKPVTSTEPATNVSDCGEPPPRGRSSLEKAGIALAVLWPITLLALVIRIMWPRIRHLLNASNDTDDNYHTSVSSMTDITMQNA